MKSFTIKIDGYSVKERLLEGVMFYVLFEVNDDYTIEDAVVTPCGKYDIEYLKSLGSVDKHVADVAEWALNDPYNILIENGDEQGVLAENDIAHLSEHRPKGPEPVEIKSTSLKDLLGG